MSDAANPHDLFINREITALAFNERVLAMAQDKSIPLLERMRFLCICSSNLDEFFEIRVAGLKQKKLLGHQHMSEGQGVDDLLHALSVKAHHISEELYRLYNQVLLPELHQADIHFLETKEWTDDIHLWAKHFFKSEIQPIMSPIALDLAHPFPRLLNKSLNFIVRLSGKDAFDRSIEYAVVHAPRSLPRMIRLPSELSEGAYKFVFLGSIIKAHIGILFPGMEVQESHAFRLTRNSDLSLREDNIDDLAEAVQKEVFSRHFGHVVRLEVAHDCPQPIVDFLLQKHKLNREDAYFCHGPVNLQRFLSVINSIDKPELNYQPFIADNPLTHHKEPSIFSLLEKQDILLHHPYQTFDVVIDFVRKAASDPNVLAISQTLYRTHDRSAMVSALVEAARSGKEVTAVIELRARFDEESNLRLANRLHEAGVIVLYGVVGFKTHAKMTLVVRRTHGILKRYVHLGTGNYHEQTAQRYTDIGLLTTEKNITRDVQSIFQQLTGLGRAAKLKTLIDAPFTLFRFLMQTIETHKKAAQEGKKVKIIIKVNGLTDRQVIQALYDASNAGVHITLLVRGVCSLRPKIKGLSEHIKVLSYVGRFLEHHRVYYFKIDEEEQIYCSSADLMERNLHHRIELMFPILAPECQKRIKDEIIHNYAKDKTNTWEMQPDGSYVHLTRDAISAQEQLLLEYTKHYRQ